MNQVELAQIIGACRKGDTKAFRTLVREYQEMVFSVSLKMLCDEDEAKDAPVQYEVTCPACGKTAVFEEDELLDGAPKCPNCGEPLDFEVTEE